MKYLVLAIILLAATPALAQRDVLVLHEQIKAVCAGIEIVSIGRWEDKTTWRLIFKDGTTDECKAAAQAVVNAYNVGG